MRIRSAFGDDEIGQLPENYFDELVAFTQLLLPVHEFPEDFFGVFFCFIVSALVKTSG